MFFALFFAGPWRPEEDAIILRCLADGLTKWSEIAERIPGRIGKQCRERYFNHLDPNINKNPWSTEEDIVLEREQTVSSRNSTRLGGAFVVSLHFVSSLLAFSFFLLPPLPFLASENAAPR